MKDFDYGVIEVSHRLNINKPINHEKIVIKGLGIVKKAKWNSNETWWEMQIIYKPNAPHNPTELFKGSLDYYTFNIKHKGNMQVEI
jgi:hypothetical protein